MLHCAIFLANCFATMKKIHCKLQETCYTLESWAAICNGFKASLQSLQEVELGSIVSDTWYNFLCYLYYNKRVARKVSAGLQCVTFALCNLFHNFFGFEMIAQSRAYFYLILQRLHGIF